MFDKKNFKTPHFHRFTNQDKYYIFDYGNLVFAELDTLFTNCFDYLENKITWENLYSQYGQASIDAMEELENLAKNNTFFSDEKRVVSLPSEYATGLISLPPVHRCNLKCSYCFAEQGKVFKEEEKKFTKEMVEKALRFIYYEYLPDCKKYRIDFVSGGEPLLNFDIIETVKEVSDRLYTETGKPMEIWVCTNGTCFTPDILNYFNENHINIGISLDGDKPIQDAMRKDAHGRGTYDRIIRWIDEIHSSKEYSKRLKDIWGMVVVTNQTPSLVEILKHHRKAGFKNVQMKIVRLKKDSPYAITLNNVEAMKEKYTDLFAFFLKELESGSVDYVKMILNDNDFAGKIIRRLLMRYLVVNRCQAGKNKVSIAANGDMYPCDSFVGMKEFKIGNVLTGLEKCQIFKQLSVISNEHCRECWAKYVCGGDCYHNCYLTNKDIEKPDQVICILEQHVIHLSLLYLDTMANEYPELYAYLQNMLQKREALK